MTKDQITERVIELVGRNARLVEPGENLEPDRDLLELGVDSFALVVLVTDIEDEFGIVIPDEFLTPEVFRSASSLADAVEELLGGGAA